MLFVVKEQITRLAEIQAKCNELVKGAFNGEAIFTFYLSFKETKYQYQILLKELNKIKKLFVVGKPYNINPIKLLSSLCPNILGINTRIMFGNHVQ